MKISNLTFLAFQLNGLLDDGQAKNVTFSKVSYEIENGTIFSYLKNTFGRSVDFSSFTPAQQGELVEEWQSILNAVDARRKFGVQHNGICLLVAYCLEGVQKLARAANA